MPYDPLLATCFEGLVEDKHPYNFIAYQCVKEMLEEEVRIMDWTYPFG